MNNPLDPGNDGRNESEEAKAILAKLELELTDLNMMLQPKQEELALDDELARIEAELTELRLQAEKVKKLKAQFQENKIDTRRSIRAITWQVEDARRAYELASETERLIEQLKAKARYFDELTRDCAWRESIMPHQVTGSDFLASAKRAICADGMGLGKTRQAIAYLDKVQSRKALVVCPGDVMRGWERELILFAPERAAVIIGKMPYALQAAKMSMWAPRANERPEDIAPQVYMINYESWARSDKIIQDMVKLQFDTVILDESHHIKNSQTVSFKGLNKLIYGFNTCGYTEAQVTEHDPDARVSVTAPVAQPHCMALALKGAGMCDNGHVINDYGWGQEFEQSRQSVTNVLCMSGTPILNNPLDIWTSTYFVNKWLFPNQNRFERDYCTTHTYTGKTVWAYGGESRLAKKIRGFYIRRTLEDAGIVLPPQEIIVHEIEFDAELYPLQAELLLRLRRSAQILIDKETGRTSKTMMMLELITRQRQGTCWPGGIKLRQPMYYWDGSPKIDPETGEQMTELIMVGDQYRESQKMDKAEELVAELNANGHRVIIFSQFKTAIDELERRLNRAHYANPDEVPMNACVFHGGVSAEQRDAIKRNFDPIYNEAVKWQNIVANFKTGSEGLNLTAASAIVILDEEWSPGKNNQAYDRIHRIGQTKATQIHILRMTNSIDDWMEALNQQKAEMLGSFDAANVQHSDLASELAKFFDKANDPEGMDTIDE